MLSINFKTKNYSNYNIVKPQKRNCNNLSPLKFDTISFCSLKKTEFNGIDLLVINKFKAPIEKFNNNEDLQKWCKKKVKDIIKQDFKGRQKETCIQREAILSEWFNYVQNENDAYNWAISLLIFDGITKDLEPDSDKLPPVLNKGILAKTIDSIQNSIKENPKFDVNFLKQYQLNLQKSFMITDDEENSETITGWIVIPSYKNDPENFENNVEKLKLLSHNNWCTKSFNAKPYLKQGDFHIYLENGKTKLGVRFINDEIEEIQGENNNSKIPVKYFDIVKEHIKNEKLRDKAAYEIEEGKSRKIEAEKLKNQLKNQLKNLSTEEIFKIFGINVKKDKDGFLIISEYHHPNGEYKDFSYEDFGINENELIKNVKAIEGDADFYNSQITKLEHLQTIGRNANFQNSQIKSLGNLSYIGGYANFYDSEITSLGKLERVGRGCDFQNSKISSLSNLNYIGGNAIFSNSKITSLNNLQYIGGNANFSYSILSNLGNLQIIGGKCYVNANQKELIEKLKEKNINFFID